MGGHEGWLIDWFITTLRDMDGNTALLSLLFVLGLCGLGLPVPEDIVLITAGFLAALGKFHVVTAVVLGMVGVLSGDAMLFFLGRWYGEGVFQLAWVQRIVKPSAIKKARKRVLENARFICFIARFLPGLRSPIYLMAGAMGISPRTYLIQDGLAAAISVPVWVVIGWYFGNEIEAAMLLMRDFQMGFLGAAVVGIVVYVLWKRRKSRAEALEDA